MGSLETLLFVVITWSVVVVALYWVIRLAVRHGFQDTQRREASRLRRAG